MTRWAAGLEYDGAAFCGWQSQRDKCGAQDALQHAFSTLNKEPLVVHAAGRTDAGVHASMQIAHFDSDKEYPASVWVRAANARLPKAIRVLWVRKVSDDFHARYSAARRYYRYWVMNQPIASAILRGFCACYDAPLAEESMNDAAKRLLGQHDFSAFRAAACQAKTPVRTMFEVSVVRHGGLLMLDFCASGFLQHMARNITGVLLEIGCGRRSPEWIDELLSGKDRTKAAKTAPAKGLCFCGAEYPEHFGLTKTKRDVGFEVTQR